MTTKAILFLCCYSLLFAANGCGGKKTAEPVDPAAAIEARLKAAEKVSDPETQTEEYLAIAAALQKSAQLPAAQKPLKLAAQAIGSINSPVAKGRLSAELAISFARGKQADESQKALVQAQAMLGKIMDDPLARTLLQTRIAVAQHELGSKQTAATTLKAAATAASALTDTEAQTRAWLGVASASQQAGQKEEVPEALHQAREAATKAASPNIQAELLLALAKTERELNLTKEAETTFAAAMATIEKIPEPLGRGFAVLEAAGTRIQMGDAEQGKALLDQLEKSLEAIPDKDQVKQLQAKLKTERGQLAKIKK